MYVVYERSSISLVAEARVVALPDRGWLVLSDRIVNYENNHNLVHDLRVAKMLELNCVVCNNLIEKSEVETNYWCDDFRPNKVIQIKGRTLYISPIHCFFKPISRVKSSNSFYITESSAKRILEKVEELFSKLNTIDLKPRSVE